MAVFVPYEGYAGDYTIPQNWSSYTDEEHNVWNELWSRQTSLLPGRTVSEFMQGLEILKLDHQGIPDFAAINMRLFAATGWQIVAVPGLVPDEIFFEHLSNRRFPAGQFIRSIAQLDYLQEPDIFHDVFGHVPLLAHPVFADYLQAYGKGGMRSRAFDALKHLARLYWYTVEFGLIQTSDGLRAYGAGILSSRTETLFSLNDESPNRIYFDLLRVMRTEYRIDDFQQSYFVIPSFEHLLEATISTDFAPIYRQLEQLTPLQPDAILESDRLLHRGKQSHRGNIA